MNPKLDESGTVHLNKAEKTQLYTEAGILQTYHCLSGNEKYKDKAKMSGKFKKRKARFDRYYSVTYLIKKVWGITSGQKYLQPLRNELVGDAVRRDVDITTANTYISFGDEV